MKRVFLVLGVLLFFFSGCKEGREKSQVSDELKGNESPKEIIHHSKLMELLPEEVAGFPKVSEDGREFTFSGYRYSQARKVYSKDGKKIVITILDYNAAESILDGTLQKIKMKSESEEKPIQIYEKEGTIVWIDGIFRGNRENLGVPVNNRFLITISTVNLAPGTAMKILDEVDLIGKLRSFPSE